MNLGIANLGIEDTVLIIIPQFNTGYITWSRI